MTGCCCGQLAAVREALERMVADCEEIPEVSQIHSVGTYEQARAALSPDSIGECRIDGDGWCIKHDQHPNECSRQGYRASVGECPQCKGAGRFAGRITDILCAVCRGTGRLQRKAECPHKAEAERLQRERDHLFDFIAARDGGAGFLNSEAGIRWGPEGQRIVLLAR